MTLGLCAESSLVSVTVALLFCFLRQICGEIWLNVHINAVNVHFQPVPDLGKLVGMLFQHVALRKKYIFIKNKEKEN